MVKSDGITVVAFTEVMESEGMEANPNLASTERLSEFSYAWDEYKFTGQQLGEEYT